MNAFPLCLSYTFFVDTLLNQVYSLLLQTGLGLYIQYIDFLEGAKKNVVCFKDWSSIPSNDSKILPFSSQ